MNDFVSLEIDTSIVWMNLSLLRYKYSRVGNQTFYFGISFFFGSGSGLLVGNFVMHDKIENWKKKFFVLSKQFFFNFCRKKVDGAGDGLVFEISPKVEQIWYNCSFIYSRSVKRPSESIQNAILSFFPYFVVLCTLLIFCTVHQLGLYKNWKRILFWFVKINLFTFS